MAVLSLNHTKKLQQMQDAEGMKKKVGVIVGTRPEAIKMAPVVRELRNSECLAPIVVATGQHREMLSQSLRVFKIVPDIDLKLMRDRQTLSDLTSRALSALSECFLSLCPDAILVQGDTTSVLAATLAAFYSQIPIGHVEAGLRTGDIHSPWPEEMNRRVVSPLSRWNFAPTEHSLQNLLAERIDPNSCFVTGNTIVDALLWGVDMVERQNESLPAKGNRLGINDQFVRRFIEAPTGRFVLITGHRRESFGDGIRSICQALKSLVQLDSDLGIVFPCHLNPNIREPVLQMLADHENISLIAPVAYVDMIWLMKSCCFIISDSGGIQEEAPTLGKPVLVTRNSTERPEGVIAGTSILVGTSTEEIVRNSSALLRKLAANEPLQTGVNPYGDGMASARIRGILEKSLG